MKNIVLVITSILLCNIAVSQTVTWVDGGSYTYPDNNERLRLKNNTSIAWFSNPGTDGETTSKARISDFFGILSLIGTQGVNISRDGVISDIVVNSNGNIGIGGATDAFAAITMRGRETKFKNQSVELDLLVDLQGGGGIGWYTDEDFMVISINDQAGSLIVNADMEVKVQTTPSDRRLKENIKNLDGALSTISELRPVQYHMIESNDQLNLGLIAQEVQETLPSIVKELKQTSEDGSPLLGIKYQELIPVLIKAIQEQQTIIEQQGKAIQKLENKVQK